MDKKPIQTQEPWNWRERLFYGGNLGLSFGTTTYIDISPIIGVKLTDRFSVGGGAIFNYYSFSYLGGKYTTVLYGGRVFARALVTENIFLQAGWDKISRENPYAIVAERVWVDNLLVGGGVRYPIGDRSSFVIMGFWNLNESPLSPYPNPIIQMGVNLGF